MHKSFNRYIPLAKPDIQKEDIAAVVDVLESGMLVQGEKVNQLEDQIKAYTDSPNCIMTSNGTSTLHLALVCLGIGPGDEVIIPAFSYVATANVVELVGATTVFVDIDLNSLNIDPIKIEEKITSKTKAIIPVHEFGYPAEMDAIINIAKQHNLYVIEDAACALGTKYKGKHVGTLGDFGSFSFHPRKSITSGEGGCLVLKNNDWTNKLKSLRNHGIDSVSRKFIDAGFNYRITDFQAAMLVSQLNRLDSQIKKRREKVKLYSNLLANNNVFITKEEKGLQHSWQTFHIIVDEKIDRDNLIKELKEKGISSNYGAQCIPAVDYYKKKYKLNAEILFPNAYRAYTKGLALPLHSALTKNEIEYISKTLINCIKNEE